jgi:hypothetical protein
MYKIKKNNMKKLENYNVKLLDLKEMNDINGGGIGRWLAQGIRAIGTGIYDAFNGQYEHVYEAVSSVE